MYKQGTAKLDQIDWFIALGVPMQVQQWQNTSFCDTPPPKHINRFLFSSSSGLLKGSSTHFICSTHLSKHKDTRRKDPLLMLGSALWSRRHSAISRWPLQHARWRGVSPSLSIPYVWIKANLQWWWTHLVGLGLHWTPEGTLLHWCALAKMCGGVECHYYYLCCKYQSPCSSKQDTMAKTHFSYLHWPHIPAEHEQPHSCLPRHKHEELTHTIHL